ncbi:MAG TPA: glycerol kinase GlpK [Paracoccus sp. (in: a-proteobacteria)]|nr:glycerol kinase GlpK [Paracoccus sp. (in: a-proteobacteria)]
MAILAIDQGTTSTRAFVFADDLTLLAQSQVELPQHFPRSGWVEHDADDIWTTVAGTARAAVERAGNPAIAAVGITNQRETAIVWDRRTGRPLHRAIVWQDRRTADLCARLKAGGHEETVREVTGLLLDPYFSATKIGWILDNVEGARAQAQAQAGDLLCGTVDCWLIWKLTGGRAHVTDATNAARTMLYDIQRGEWSAELCDLFGVPMAMLPRVLDCADDFGMTRADLFGAEIPILGVAGDQQAAAIGQACFDPGMIKATYGTGCFALLNTGDAVVRSDNRLLTTIACRLNGATTYALEGSIFVAGAAVQWLRDGLGIIRDAAETGALAGTADPGQDVVLVPAFTGLGAPYWQPEARGAVFGLTRATGPAEFARAALESVGFQTRDLYEAMRRDWPALPGSVLRVDGGMAASDPAMQFLADILGASVDRPAVTETTVRGAAWLAAYRAGLAGGPQDHAATWQLDRRFEPGMADDLRKTRYARWQRAVDAVIAAG